MSHTNEAVQRRVWVHVGHACDGLWVKGFQTAKAAYASLKQYALGVPETDEPISIANREFYSDNGSTHMIRPLSIGMTTAIYRRLLDAYDAREMGKATPHQTALLDRWSF